MDISLNTFIMSGTQDYTLRTLNELSIINYDNISDNNLLYTLRRTGSGFNSTGERMTVGQLKQYIEHDDIPVGYEIGNALKLENPDSKAAPPASPGKVPMFSLYTNCKSGVLQLSNDDTNPKIPMQFIPENLTAISSVTSGTGNLAIIAGSSPESAPNTLSLYGSTVDINGETVNINGLTLGEYIVNALPDNLVYSDDNNKISSIYIKNGDNIIVTDDDKITVRPDLYGISSISSDYGNNFVITASGADLALNGDNINLNGEIYVNGKAIETFFEYGKVVATTPAPVRGTIPIGLPLAEEVIEAYYNITVNSTGEVYFSDPTTNSNIKIVNLIIKSADQSTGGVARIRIANGPYYFVEAGHIAIIKILLLPPSVTGIASSTYTAVPQSTQIIKVS